MNKREAKIEALELSILLIMREIYSPTELTLDYGENNPVHDHMNRIATRLQKQLDKLTDRTKNDVAAENDAPEFLVLYSPNATDEERREYFKAIKIDESID